MMNAYSWSFALYLVSFEAHSSANILLTTSTEKATFGNDFHFTCSYNPFNNDVVISRDSIPECRFKIPCRLYDYNISYSCTCNDTTITLTIPGSFDIDTLHGSQWMCYDMIHLNFSQTVLLYVTVPIKQVTIRALPYDRNPIVMLSGSSQQFTCTTNAVRPSSTIQWYMSGLNITEYAAVKTEKCDPGCNNTVISSSVLVYIGQITDNGETIYCTASNVDAEIVGSQSRQLDILFKPVILDLPDINISEGSNLTITPTINANPDPISIWWTRQNEPQFIYYGTNLTIKSIQRVSSGSYTCHAMNTVTVSGHPTQNKTSEENFYVNVQFVQRLDSFNNTAIGVGTGIAVVILIIGVTILNLYLYRKRQMSKTTEQSNSEVYETELQESRGTTQTDNNVYQEFGDIKTDADQLQKGPEPSTNCYEDMSGENSNKAGYDYEIMNTTDNEQSKGEVYETELHEPRETPETDTHVYNELEVLKTEQSNSEVYETELIEPRETSETDTHVYNELEGPKTDADQLQKSPETSTNSYVDMGGENSNKAGFDYEIMNTPDNEKQIHKRDPALYVNLDL